MVVTVFISSVVAFSGRDSIARSSPFASGSRSRTKPLGRELPIATFDDTGYMESYRVGYPHSWMVF